MKIALLVGVLLIADNATEAGVRFKRGLELYEKGAIREALEQFLVSYRLSPNPNIAYNIATCFEHLKSFEAAFSAYSEYLAFDTLTPKERQDGEAALAQVIPLVARLTVKTTPPGAEIFLDRVNLGRYGVTPRTFAAAPGEHEIILTLPGHVTRREAIKLEKGREVIVTVDLARLSGRVEIVSVPVGAEIREDDENGALIGVTPVELSMPIGPRVLHFSVRGHVDEVATVDVRADETTRVRVSHRPLPERTGRVRVLTNVPTALISVDGREAGFSPLVLELPEGEHGVAVHQVGFRPWTRQLDVSADRLLAAEVTLEPKIQETGRGVWPWVLLTTSGVAAVTALGLSIQALRSRSAFDDDPSRSQLDRTQALNIGADVMWVVTLLGSAATVATFLLQDAPKERDSSATITEVDQLATPRSQPPGL